MKNWCMWLPRVIVSLGFFGMHMSLLVATSIITTAPGGNPLTGYQATAPIFTNGDRIRGHVMFKNGFNLSSGAIAWSGFGIVNGPIDFTTETSALSLYADLKLGSTGRFTSSFSTRPRVSVNGNDRTIFLGGNTVIDMDQFICKQGPLTIDGRGCSLTCTDSFGQFYGIYAYADSVYGSLTLKNMNLIIAGRKLDRWALMSEMETIVLECMTIQSEITSSYVNTNALAPNLFEAVNSTYSHGDFKVVIRGRVALEGAKALFTLFCDRGTHTRGTIRIEKNSTLYIGKGVTLSLGTAPVTFEFADKTSVLHFDGCDFNIGLSGVALTKGTVIFENKVRIFNKDYIWTGSSYQWVVNTDMTKGLIFGDGTPENEVDVKILGGAYVIVEGCMASK